MIRSIFGLILVLVLGAIMVAVVPDIEYSEEIHGVGLHYTSQGMQETGSANLVTAVIVAYRGLDTLGEVVVLFCASTSVVLILSLYPLSLKVSRPSFIVAQTSRLLPAPILLLGLYLIAHSHLSPGGGFPGGAVIASAFLLVMLGGTGVPGSSRNLAAVESLAGLSFGLLGFWGVMKLGQFLNNLVLGTGTPGSLVSAGLIPLISLVIGIKVASELSSVFAAFRYKGGH